MTSLHLNDVTITQWKWRHEWRHQGQFKLQAGRARSARARTGSLPMIVREVCRCAYHTIGTLFSLDNVHTDVIGSLHRDFITWILIHRDVTKLCAKDGCNQNISRNIEQTNQLFRWLVDVFKFHGRYHSKSCDICTLKQHVRHTSMDVIGLKLYRDVISRFSLHRDVFKVYGRYLS